MPLGALIGGTSLVGGMIAAKGAKDAAKIQSDAAGKATDTQLKMFEMTRKDLDPFVGVGREATYSLADLYGLPTPSRPEGGTPYGEESIAAFRRSPDYDFALKEGLRGIEMGAAARGGLLSGGTLKALQERGTGLASQNFGNYVSRLSDLARMGLSGAGMSSNAALSTGRGVADTTMAGGEAAASGVVGSGNAINTALGDFSSNLALYKLMNPVGSSYKTSLVPRSVGLH